MATPFELDRGTRQGRIEGGYELGHADLVDVYLELDDHHEVSQTFVITAGSKLVRANVRVRTPDRLPASGVWELTMQLNGDDHYRRTFEEAGREIVVHPVVRLNGAPEDPDTNVVTLRLRLL